MALAVTLRDQSKFAVFTHDSLSGGGRFVGENVLLHVLISEACIGFLMGIFLDLASDHLIFRVVSAYSLKLSILLTAGIGAVLGEGTIHDDHILCKVDFQSVLHFYFLLIS